MHLRLSPAYSRTGQRREILSFGRGGLANRHRTALFRARAGALGGGLYTQPALDEMVKARSANLAALDGGGVRGGGLAPLLLDLQQHRQEHNPNGQHEEGPRAHTRAPYRWVRHPLYSVGSMFFASLSVLTANWF